MQFNLYVDICTTLRGSINIWVISKDEAYNSHTLPKLLFINLHLNVKSNFSSTLSKVRPHMIIIYIKVYIKHKGLDINNNRTYGTMSITQKL